MDITETIRSQLQAHPVLLYMKGTPTFPQCGFSARAVELLEACGATYHSVNILEEPELREALKRYSNWPTYPQLYIGGELIGGCDIMIDMHQNGELQKALAAKKPAPAA